MMQGKFLNVFICITILFLIVRECKARRPMAGPCPPSLTFDLTARWGTDGSICNIRDRGILCKTGLECCKPSFFPGNLGLCNAVDVDDCVGVTCNGNGRCVDEDGGFSCLCLSGFTGQECEMRICPATWTFAPGSSTCLRLSSFAESIAETRVACDEDGGRLAQLATRAQVDEANALLGFGAGVTYWVDISLQTEFDCNSYTTADGASIPDSSPLWNDATGEPNNCDLEAGLHCVVLRNGDYFDANEVAECNAREYFFHL